MLNVFENKMLDVSQNKINSIADSNFVERMRLISLYKKLSLIMIVITWLIITNMFLKIFAFIGAIIYGLLEILYTQIIKTFFSEDKIGTTLDQFIGSCIFLPVVYLYKLNIPWIPIRLLF